MLLGDAVMLFHRKMRHYKKYRALTDTDPLVIYIMPSVLNQLREGGRKLQLELPFLNSAWNFETSKPKI